MCSLSKIYNNIIGTQEGGIIKIKVCMLKVHGHSNQLFLPSLENFLSEGLSLEAQLQCYNKNLYRLLLRYYCFQLHTKNFASKFTYCKVPSIKDINISMMPSDLEDSKKLTGRHNQELQKKINTESVTYFIQMMLQPHVLLQRCKNVRITL